MKKRLFAMILCCFVLCAWTVFAAPAAQAAGQTYVISFRPGEHGGFSDAAVEYLRGFGTVQKTGAGNLFLEVESGTPFPANILSYLDADDGYYYKNGLAGGTVTEDATYVAQYSILSGGGVMYTVKFVDSASGAEVAESYTGYANEGDVIPFAAKTVNGYNVDSQSKSITVTAGAEISFLYTSNGTLDGIEYQYGEDTVQTQTVNVVGGGQAPANNPANPVNPDANAGNPPEVIPENDVPLNNGTPEMPGQDAPVEDIGDNDIPLAAPETQAPQKSQSSGGNGATIGLAILAAVAVIAVAAGVGYCVRKKKD